MGHDPSGKTGTQFVKIPWEKNMRCKWCGSSLFTRGFFKAFVMGTEIGIYCGLCKDAWESYVRSRNAFEGHIMFFAEHEIKRLENVPSQILKEVSNALHCHRKGLLKEALRNYGVAGEMLARELFIRYFGDEEAKQIRKLEDILGRLRHQTSREEDLTGNFCLVEQLYSVQWLRNKVGHPTKFEPSPEDARIALMAVLNTCAKMFPTEKYYF